MRTFITTKKQRVWLCGALRGMATRDKEGRTPLAEDTLRRYLDYQSETAGARVARKLAMDKGAVFVTDESISRDGREVALEMDGGRLVLKANDRRWEMWIDGVLHSAKEPGTVADWEEWRARAKQWLAIL